jgi:hypothetical protein
MKKILFMLFMFFLMSCEQNGQLETKTESKTPVNSEQQTGEKEEKDMPSYTYNDIIETFSHPETGQTYKIVNAYKLFYNYINSVRQNPDISPSHFYSTRVHMQTTSDCFKYDEFHDWQSILREEEDFKEIELLLKRLENDDHIETMKDALIKSSDILPSEEETTVCIFPSKGSKADMWTLETGKIIVLYNRDYNRTSFKAGIAHEYHHKVWYEKHFDNNKAYSTLDHLIIEGKAVMFEKIVYPKISWTYIDTSYDKEHWSKIENDLHKKEDWNRLDEILFGGNGLPKSYGYSEGYKMVKSYLDLHPNVPIEEWTGLSTSEIFEGGHYLENYK